MLQKFAGSCPLARLSDQHLVDETLESRRHFMAIFQLWRRHVAYSTHCLKWEFVEEWRLTIHHLDYHDALHYERINGLVEIGHLQTLTLTSDQMSTSVE